MRGTPTERAPSRWTFVSLRRAMALGIAAGLGEALLRLSYRYIGGRMQIHTNMDIVWMAPLADAVVFLLAALGLMLALQLTARGASRATKLSVVTGALVSLAVWSLTERVPQIGRWPGAILGLGAGVAVGGGLRRRGESPTAIDRAFWPLGAAVVVLGGVVIVGGVLRERRALASLPAAESDMPNVLLLILDTVRAESTSLYGYSRATTPALAALADSGVRFDRAFATAPWTLPSHGTLFTGRYPHEISVDWTVPLDDSVPTLAERFRDAGYMTGGFVGNYFMSWEVGLHRGFVHYEDYLRNVKQLAMSSSLATWVTHWPRLRRAIKWYDHVNRKTADEVNAAALRWIGARGARPYFAFLNYMDAHEFYLPPAPFATAVSPDTARKNWLIEFSMENGGIAFRGEKEAMKPHEVQAELNAYEAAIAYVDSRIAALLDSLESLGALRNTVVVVTSDHGEQFSEHGRFGHGNSLYPQLLHVPLVIWSPGRVPAGVRVRERVTLRDLAATIESFALGRVTLPGSTLASYWDGDSTTYSSSPILASRTTSRRELLPDSVRHGAWATVMGGKLVIEFVGGPPTTEVYDLDRDPLAARNLVNLPEVHPVVDSARRLYGGMRWLSRDRAAQRAGRP